MGSASIRVGVRLGLGFTAMLIVAALIAAVGSSRLTELAGMVERVTEIDARKERLARDWRTGVEVNAARAYAILSSTDAKALNDALKPVMAETSKAISERQKELETLVQSPEGKAILAKVATARSAYTKSREQALAAAGTPDGARIFKDETVPRMSAYLAAVVELTDWQQRVITASGQRAAQTAQQGSSIMIALAVIALVLGGALSWLISRSITRPLAEAVAVADTVAAGDLTREVRATRGDEIGQLQRALQGMTASLREVIGTVNGSARQIATASDEIARGNQDLSTRTEQQAGSLQQTASAMEQLAGAIEANARSAQDASRLAAESATLAARGGEVVGEVMSTMAGISQASGEIGQIISVIDGIAFQTNILALNAAVEAARAGEQGRGFAVVAGEVRTLAQRSAEAARQIKSLIETSAARVDVGTRLVEDAGATMKSVTDSVQRMTTLIDEISGALAEQSSGIGQVNTAVAQLDQVTQQNAALVEEAAAAAESTKHQASGLAQAVAVFRL